MLVLNLKVHFTLFFKLNLWAFYILFQECNNGKQWVDGMEQLQHLLFLFIIPRTGCKSFVVQLLCNNTCDQTLKLRKKKCIGWNKFTIYTHSCTIDFGKIFGLKISHFLSVSICSCMENEVYFYFSFYAHAWVLDRWACYFEKMLHMP